MFLNCQDWPSTDLKRPSQLVLYWGWTDESARILNNPNPLKDIFIVTLPSITFFLSICMALQGMTNLEKIQLWPQRIWYTHYKSIHMLIKGVFFLIFYYHLITSVLSTNAQYSFIHWRLGERLSYCIKILLGILMDHEIFGWSRSGRTNLSNIYHWRAFWLLLKWI